MAFVNLLQIIYPVGSFYISRINTSPSSIIGGTWTKLSNAALRAGSSVGYTGSDTHTITKDEMPAHRHDSLIRIQWYNTDNRDGVADTYSTKTNLGVDRQTNYTAYAGAGEAMSIIQRSYNCYMWYRTA